MNLLCYQIVNVRETSEARKPLSQVTDSEGTKMSIRRVS